MHEQILYLALPLQSMASLQKLMLRIMKDSIDTSGEVQQVGMELSWIDPIIEYLTKGILSDDVSEALR